MGTRKNPEKEGKKELKTPRVIEQPEKKERPTPLREKKKQKGDALHLHQRVSASERKLSVRQHDHVKTLGERKKKKI